MTSPARLSALDQSPIAAGSTAAQAIANTLDLARAADRLGYRRYRLAEHRAAPALASCPITLRALEAMNSSPPNMVGDVGSRRLTTLGPAAPGACKALSPPTIRL